MLAELFSSHPLTLSLAVAVAGGCILIFLKIKISSSKGNVTNNIINGSNNAAAGGNITSDKK
jgi:hypothetical protein